MLLEELGKLTQDQPQTLDSLFEQSKEGIMLEKVKLAITALLPEIKQDISSSLQTTLLDEIKRQIGAIRIRDGIDGKTPIKGIHYFDGEPGKDAEIDEGKIISEVYAKVMEKIPPLALNRQRGGHGGGTGDGGGGGFTLLTPTGTINGTNADFVFTEKPTYIISDGAWYTENKGWTWSGFTATMTIPPNDNVYGFK